MYAEIGSFWSYDHLRPWQRTHCCEHINCCRHKCFPVCLLAQHLLRTQILCPGHKKCLWFCSETFCVRFAQPKKHQGRQCVHNNVFSFTRAFTPPLDIPPVNFKGSETDKIRQIANQNHEIYAEFTDCRINKTSKICYTSTLCLLLYLQGLNLNLWRLQLNKSWCRSSL